MQPNEHIRQVRDAIIRQAAAHGARNVRIFGSVVRGDDRDTSDVDFLVTLDAGRTLLDLARLELELENLLGRPVDVVTEAGLREPLRSAALSEAVAV